MTVIMSYHALVERDSKYVDNHWKITTCVLLLAVASSACLSSFNLNEIQSKFGYNCFINAEIEFFANNTAPPKEQETVPSPPDEEQNRTTNELQKREILKLNIFQLKTIKEVKLPQLRNASTTPATRVTISKKHKINEDLKIDEHETNWGSQTQCATIKFLPILEGYIAIIWLILFIMCGNGGKGNASFLTKPWSIVCPSLIFFGLFTIISFAFMFYISDKLNEFCNNLKLQVENSTEYSCGEIFNHFTLNQTMVNDLTASTNYTLVKLCVFVTFLLWLFLLLIILLRIIFVIDFQLIRVTISKMNMDHLEIVDLEEKI